MATAMAMAAGAKTRTSITVAMARFSIFRKVVIRRTAMAVDTGQQSQHTVDFACVEISAGLVGPEISSECPAGIRRRRIDQLWAILNDEFCADVKSVMKELELLMSEIYDHDVPAEATVVETLEVANITAMLRYESVDANGNANDDLSRQFSVDQPFYCDQNQLTKLLSQEGSSSL